MSDAERAALRLKMDKEDAIRSLKGFLRYMWPEFHGQAQLLDAPYIDVMCDWIEDRVMMRKSNGYLGIPPGKMKSLAGQVMSPAWVWLHNPRYQAVWLSASVDVVSRDSARCRELVNSERYQDLLQMQVARLRHFDNWRGGPWHDVLLKGDKPWAIKHDRNQVLWFETTAGGRRQCLQLGAKRLTGLRGDGWGVDDAVDVSEVINKPPAVVRRRMLEITADILMRLWNRINDPRPGHHHRMLIGQRTHTMDPPGYMIQHKGWDHLVLPTEYDPAHPHCSPLDPRTEPGEPLNPHLDTPAEIADRKTSLGASQHAAQEQQGPLASTGSELDDALDATWESRFWEHPSGLKIEKRWASTDATFGTTKVTSSRVAIEAWGKQGAILYMYDLDAALMSWPMMRDRCLAFSLAQMPSLDHFIVEDKALGPALVSDLKLVVVNVDGFNPGSQSKEARIGVLSARMRSGQVRLPHPDAPWQRKLSCQFGEIATLIPIARARGDKWPDTIATEGQVMVPWVVLFEAECRNGTGRADLPDAAAQAVIWDQRERDKRKATRHSPHAPAMDTEGWFGGNDGGGIWTGSDSF